MTDLNQIRINELARELEVKAKAIIDYLPEAGVTEKKTHSSSIDVDAAERVRKHFRDAAEEEAAAEQKAVAEKAAKEAAAKAARMKPAVVAPPLAPPVAAAPRAGSSQAGQLVTSAAIAEASTAYAVEVFSSPENGATSFTVPAGHRFVVEQLSGWCNVQYWFAVRARLNGQQFTHFFNTITNVAGAGRVFNIMTKFYVDDSGSVLPSQIPAGGCGVTMSGFLVSM